MQEWLQASRQLLQSAVCFVCLSAEVVVVTVVTVVTVVVVSVVLVLELVLVELLVLELVLVELLVLVVVEGAAVSATVGAAVSSGDRTPQLSCSASSSAETVISLASQPAPSPSPSPVEADKRVSSGSSEQLHAGGVPVPDATTAMPQPSQQSPGLMTPTTIFIEVDTGCADEPGDANPLGTAPPALSPS